jgi:hypothetical protein
MHEELVYVSEPKPRRPDQGAGGEAWEWYEAAMDRWRSQNGGRGRTAGRTARAVVSGAITLYGSAASLQHQPPTPLRNEGDVIGRTERTDRARTQRGATRDAGSRRGESGRG